MCFFLQKIYFHTKMADSFCQVYWCSYQKLFLNIADTDKDNFGGLERQVWNLDIVCDNLPTNLILRFFDGTKRNTTRKENSQQFYRLFFRKNHYKVQRKAPMEQRRVMPMKAQKITVYWSILPCYETKSSEHKLKILKNFQMLKMTEWNMDMYPANPVLRIYPFRQHQPNKEISSHSKLKS